MNLPMAAVLSMRLALIGQLRQRPVCVFVVIFVLSCGTVRKQGLVEAVMV